jgi:hypothetical protein
MPWREQTAKTKYASLLRQTNVHARDVPIRCQRLCLMDVLAPDGATRAAMSADALRAALLPNDKSPCNAQARKNSTEPGKTGTRNPRKRGSERTQIWRRGSRHPREKPSEAPSVSRRVCGAGTILQREKDVDKQVPFRQQRHRSSSEQRYRQVARSGAQQYEHQRQHAQARRQCAREPQTRTRSNAQVLNGPQGKGGA